jgi:hypothetical protein
MSINKKLSLLLETYVTGSSITGFNGTKHYIEIFKDPNSQELEGIYKDELGDGGCRIGINKLGVIYCWSDTIEHDRIEKELNTKFVNGKFIYPSKYSTFIVISSGYDDDKEAFNKFDVKCVKKLLSIFDRVQVIKDNNFSILYDNR